MSKVDVKIVLLGKEAGGKTSLVERFVHQRFSDKNGNKPYQAVGSFIHFNLEVNLIDYHYRQLGLLMLQKKLT